jgi:hypothetical protein
VVAKELKAVGYSARRTMGEIERAVKNFDANPSRILWGGSGSTSSNTSTSTNTTPKPVATSKPVAASRPVAASNPVATPKPAATPKPVTTPKPVATSSNNAKPIAAAQ